MKKPSSLAEATEQAVALSKENGYSCIVLSRDQYHIETDPPLIRVWEQLIAEYENGELIVNE